MASRSCGTRRSLRVGQGWRRGWGSAGGRFCGSDGQDDRSPWRCPSSPALAAGQERLGRATFSWQLQAPNGRLLGLLCPVRQLKGSPAVLLTWFGSHQSCLPAEVWVTGICNAGGSGSFCWGGFFNWTKCLRSQVLCALSARNHRITEWFGLEGTLKIIWSQPPCHEQGHLPPDQAAQSSIQLGLEQCQGGGSHSFSGQPGPGPHHPHGEEFLPNI